MLDLKQIYEYVCSVPSDIYLHIPVLYEYALKCKHVTEMGARTGNSSIAFLHARPEKFVSYDYQYATPEPHLKQGVEQLIFIFEECKRQGINCEYIGADVLKVEIEETDMLFIDTWHCYNQLKRELELHAGKVRKFIAFHDTEQFATVGEKIEIDVFHPHKHEDGGGGILKAITEFLEANPTWKVVYSTPHNNGLTVIEKQGSAT